MCKHAYKIIATPYTIEYEGGVWQDEHLHQAPLGAPVHPESYMVGRGCELLDFALRNLELRRRPIVCICAGQRYQVPC